MTTAADTESAELWRYFAEPRCRPPSRQVTRRGTLAGMLLGVVIIVAGCTPTGSTSHAASSSAAGVPDSRSDSSVGAAANGSSDSSATVSPTLAGSSLCQVLATINKAAATATNPTEGLNVLRQYDPQLTAAASTAPPAAHSDIAVLTDAVNKALSSGDLSGLAADPIVTAGTHLLALCGETSPPTADPTK